MSDVVEKAIQKAGSVTGLAKIVGVKAPSICKWRKNRRVPPRHMFVVAQLLSVPPQDVCPELFTQQSEIVHGGAPA